MIYKLPRPNNRLLALLGVALLLLVFSCEQEEVHQPSSQPPGQQQVLNQFFESYTPKRDGFRDKVVERLLAVNDSTGLIFDLASRYGQPNWLVRQATTAKSEPFLIVPVCQGADSVSAVFVFLQQDSSLLLKIFEANSPDTLIADFVLHCQCSLFPNKEYSSRKTEPETSHSKVVEEIEFCWVTKTSIDGGKTWIESYRSCTRKVILMTTLIVDFGGTDSASDGGSGGSGSGGGSSRPNTTGLGPIAMKNLQKAEENLKNGPCLGKTVYNATWYSGLTAKINPLRDGDAGINKNGIIEFKNDAAINTTTLLHELMHAYQFQQNPNIEYTQAAEFEAWLLVDLYLVSMGMDVDGLTGSFHLPESWQKDYYNWVKSIYENGFTAENRSYCTLWTKRLMAKSKRYSELPTGTGSFPSTVNSLLTKCKNN